MRINYAIMSSYASEWPAVEVDSAFKKYFEEFYYISDTPDAHDKYVQQFTSNATLTMASRTARGSDGTQATSHVRLTSLIPD